jgi:hypothetical protein
MEYYTIPPITDPLGKYWDQPPAKEVLVDLINDVAIMTPETLQQLADYSHSTPTGVYIGKMWRSETRGGKHFLHWFDHCEKPGYLTHHVKEIALI